MNDELMRRLEHSPSGKMAIDAFNSVDWEGLRQRSTAALEGVKRGIFGDGPQEGSPDFIRQNSAPDAEGIRKLTQSTIEHFSEKPPFDWGAFNGPSGVRDDPMRERQADATVPLAVGTMGGGTAFAPRGSLGMAGGKLVQPMKSAEHIDQAATMYDGKVYTGQLHSDSVGKLIEEMGMTEQQFEREHKKMVQGYVTNTGRFLERDEATKLTGGTKPIHGDATYMTKEKPLIPPLNAKLLQDAAGNRNNFDSLLEQYSSLKSSDLQAVAKDVMGYSPTGSKAQIIDAMKKWNRQFELNADRSAAQSKIKP